MVRRRNGTRFGAAIALTVSAWAVAPATTTAAVLEINCAGSIQSCVDAASPGDTVVIPAGTFNEAVVLTKAVSLRGAGAGVTIIDATGLAARPLTVSGAAVDATVVIEQLTLTGGDVSAGNICFPTPDNCGGGLVAFGTAQPTLRDLEITANRAYRGGGIHAEAGSSLTLERVSVSGNASVLTGGGINSSASLTLLDSTVDANASENNAGGGINVGLQPVVLPLPTLVIEDSTITDNHTGTVGGSIHDGGGVNAFAFDVTVRRSVISDNSCGVDCSGGGIDVLSNFETAVLTLDDVTVSGNTATELGGGVAVGGSVEVSVSNSRFESNEAAKGGGLSLGLFALAPVQSVTATSFTANHATPIGLSFNDGAGGGVFAQNCGGTFSGLTFTANTALDGGGFACAFSPLAMSDSAFVSNSATGDGGGLYASFGADLTRVDFSGNTADGDGGGASVAGPLVVDQIAATANQADGSGGAVAVRSGSFAASNSSFTSNRADGAILFFSEGGGALHVVGDASVSDSTFDGNQSPEAAGGGMWAFGAVDMTDVVASGNAAATGGAVFTRGPVVDLERVTMTGNQAVETTTSSGTTFGGQGGGLRAIAASSGDLAVTIDGSHFESNGAIGSFARGGAVAVDGAFSVNASSFVANSSDASGGAISNSFAPMSIVSTTIENNTAVAGNGGGVSAAVPFPEVLTVTDSTVRGNTAGGNGGGININGWIDATDSVFEANQSTGGVGGGVAATGLFTDLGGRYHGNVAAGNGGAIFSNSNLELSGTTVSANTSGADGGGAFVNSSLFSTSSTFDSNVAAGDGGGAFVDFRHDIDATVFTSNAAGGDGGGLLVDRSGPITDSTVAGNSAVGGGGGVAVTGAGSIAVDLSTSTISANNAGVDGGGVLVAGSQPVNLANATLSGNDAIGAGDGIAATGTSVVALHHVTLAGAQAEAVAGMSGEIGFTNTLVAGACSQAGATFVSAGGNLESPSDTCGFSGLDDQVNVASGPSTIGPLADNGGATLTHALPTGSPAVDAGIAPCAPADQRGVLRSDGLCDVGAYELVQVHADADGPYEVVEGSTVVLDGTNSSDDGGGPLTYSWAPSTHLDDATLATPTYSGVDDTVDALTLTVTSAAGISDSDATTVTVLNAPPSIGSMTASPSLVAIGDPVQFSATFTDPGLADTHTASLAWGDGTTAPAAVGQGAGSGTVAATHAFTEPGVYVLELTVSDDDGGAATATYQYVVVFDQEGGFVTGGGWIDVAAGACTLDDDCAAASGKANFGFVSRYKKGAATPSGSTEFNFSAGGLNFHSSQYDWLIVNQAGSNAQFKGEGTVNGSAAPTGDLYRFMVWANDLDPDAIDTFRVRIWYDTGGGEVTVFDNGAADQIGGGNITVHTKKK
jgi:hypothetical protein